MLWWAPFYQYHKKQTPLTGLTLTISARPHRPGCECSRVQRLSAAAEPGTLLSASPPAGNN